MFEKRGFKVSRIDTPGSPIVLAERASPVPAAKTLTFYMHYDGQPTEAKDWTRGQPFVPAAYVGDTRVEMRLVSGLDANRQYQRLLAHIRAQGSVVVDREPDAATRRMHPKIARVAQEAASPFVTAKASMDDPRTKVAADAIRALDQRLVQMPTIGGSLPFATFNDTLKLPTIGLAVVNFDNNQHAVNENLRVGHLWEAIEIFAALLTMR